MIHTAIRHTPISNVNDAGHDAERRPLLLDRCCEGLTVICGRRRHIHRPAGVDLACVHVKGNDEMFYGLAAIGGGHCVQKQRA